MPTVERFEDLRVWQEARKIVFIEYLKRTPFEGPKLREPDPEWHIEQPET